VSGSIKFRVAGIRTGTMSGLRNDARSEQREEEEEGLVARMYKYGGAFSLIGLTFFYQIKEGERPILICLEGLNRDGESYRAGDVRANQPLADSVTPGELTVEVASKRPRDAVIALLKQLKFPTRPYLDPLADRPASWAGEFWTPEAELGFAERGRRAPGHSAVSEHGQRGRGSAASGFQGGERFGTPLQRAPWSPPRQPSVPPFVHAVPGGYQESAGAPGFPRGAEAGFQPMEGMGFQQPFQQPLRPVLIAPVIPPMHMGGGFAGLQQGRRERDRMNRCTCLENSSEGVKQGITEEPKT
jgi:hypothetical protein